jgi:hypothetical protein
MCDTGHSNLVFLSFDVPHSPETALWTENFLVSSSHTQTAGRILERRITTTVRLVRHKG